jgi:hypothetical protein
MHDPLKGGILRSLEVLPQRDRSAEEAVLDRLPRRPRQPLEGRELC